MKEALDLYRDMQEINIIPKIRTISPLLNGFAALGDSETCFKLFEDLVEEYELLPAEREYLSMLKVTVICNDQRFYTVLNQFMEDILVPSKAVWEVVTHWFLKCENKNIPPSSRRYKIFFTDISSFMFLFLYFFFNFIVLLLF